MSVKATATEAAQAWVTAMQGAGTKYTAGVQAVKIAPGQLAAAAAPLWAQNVAAAQPKFAANVAKITLAAWQNAAATKGAPRLGTGATAAQPKMAAFMTAFLPTLTNIVNGLPAGGTYEQNKARFLAYSDALHAAAGSF
jgi:hypothetical protein